MPGLPEGKPAGLRCPHLTDAMRCALWGDPRRPAVCGGLRPQPEMCGETREQALHYLVALEARTQP